MNSEEIAKIIKEIRKNNNLTQKEFAEKYHVSFQAVSKWETGKSMPDVSILKEICKDYNISIDKMLIGKKNNYPKIFKYCILIVITMILSIGIYLYLNQDDDFEFKTITTNCANFNITGNIAYNDNKSYLHLSNITYCGGEENNEYKEINCTLYEQNEKKLKKLDNIAYNSDKLIKLETFLKDVEFSLDNFSKECNYYNDNSLFLEINAKLINDKVIFYKIPLNLKNICN